MINNKMKKLLKMIIENFLKVGGFCRMSCCSPATEFQGVWLNLKLEASILHILENFGRKEEIPQLCFRILEKGLTLDKVKAH